MNYALDIKDIATTKRFKVITRLYKRTAIPALSMLLVGCTSSGFPVDDDSCQFYGDTVWDKCWWFNNSWIFGIGIAGTLYGLGWKYILKLGQNDRKFGSTFGGLLYLFIGTPIALFSALFLTILFEKLLTNA